MYMAALSHHMQMSEINNDDNVMVTVVVLLKLLSTLSLYVYL